MYQPTQLEINEIIDLHRLYSIDRAKGKQADFSDMDLSGLKVSGAVLRNACFNGANISHCDFSNCKLTGAKFNSTIGECATFTNCDLDSTSWVCSEITKSAFFDSTAVGAEMYDADFSGTTFLRTDLSEVNLANAKLNGTHLNDVDLCDAVGNCHEVITLQLGGHTAVYTSMTLQIGKFDMSIEDWKETVKCHGQNLSCESCRDGVLAILNVAKSSLMIINQYPATPLMNI